MDNHAITAFSVKTFLRQMRERIEEAAGTATAADALARAGLTGRGVAVANDIDELIHDAERLLGLVTMVVRSADPGGDETAHPAHDHDGLEQPAADAAEPTPRSAVDRTLADATIQAFLALAHARLHAAVGIARAAEIRAATSGPRDGARLALDVEPLLYEVKTLVNAASLMNRLGNMEPADPPD